MNLSIVAIVFVVIFLAELPDKSMFASLALSTRYKRLYVWLGAATAFLIHVIIAVTAGHFLTLLPKHIVGIIVALLFAIGGVLLLLGKSRDKEKVTKKRKTPSHVSQNFMKVYIASFLLVFLGEWGDVTQIATANYAAKYHNSLSVGVGALLGLWAVAAFGIVVGSEIIERIPARIVQRIAGIILLIFALLSAITALH